MFAINKSAEEQELINKAIVKVMEKTKKRCSEGLAITTALKEFNKR